jgi:hypothetical protein
LRALNLSEKKKQQQSLQPGQQPEQRQQQRGDDTELEDEDGGKAYRSSQKASEDNKATLSQPESRLTRSSSTSSTSTTSTALMVGGISIYAMRLRFLWAAYEPIYWYWEVIETFRRITLTALLSIIQPGTSDQNVFSILLAIFFMKLYATYRPYINQRNDFLAEIGQLQIFFTFFVALVVNNQLLSNRYEAAMDSLLLLLNFSVMFFIFYHTICKYLEIRAMNAADAEATAAASAREEEKNNQYDEEDDAKNKANNSSEPVEIELTTVSNPLFMAQRQGQRTASATGENNSYALNEREDISNPQQQV